MKNPRKPTPSPQRTRWRLALASCALAALAACGGGGGDDELSCSVTDQKTWLADYMDDWYYWAAITPNVDPAAYGSTAALFDAALFDGNAEFPADRWSFLSDTADFDQFFQDGRELGYGVFVAGLEVENRPDLPLRVRFVAPQSPSAGRVQRGDTIVTVNGRPAAELIADGDFSAFTPATSGDVLTLGIRRNGIDSTVAITARVYDLQPVHDSRVLTSPQGRSIGYLVLKDFISQARTPLDDAFARFRDAGVQSVVLDLRYNGGGLVSVATELASYVVGGDAVGEVFSTLRFNDRHAREDRDWRFVDRLQSLGLARVYVLAGERTCSASELVINGLRPFVEVVQIGGATCGKPVGFLPADRCGTTVSAVNFEAVNADNLGRYWDGLVPTCAVADDFDHALGDPAEALTAAALSHADTGACPAGTAAREAASSTPRHRVLRDGPLPEPRERRGMLDR